MSQDSSSPHPGALAGVKVLDLAQLITGPWCASLLGDLGAEVIKIESPRVGEALRHIGPRVGGEAVLFLAVNRNKRSLTLDLSRPAGRAVLGRLLAGSDVLIQNFRPDVRQAYGLDYQDLAEKHPHLICLNVSAFGEQGPYRLKPGTDHVFQGLSGLMSISGQPGQGPLRVGAPVADMTAALLACQGVLAALLFRQRSGRGQEVKVNLLDAAMSLQQTTITEYLLTGRQQAPTGNSSPFASPVGMFSTADGQVNLAAFNDKFWRALCRALALEPLLDDPRFAGPAQRITNREALEAILAERLRQQPTAHWLAVLEAADVPCGPVHDYPALFADPQVQANGLTRRLEHPELGAVATLGHPLRFGLCPAREGAAAPSLGQDNQRILADLGLSAQEIEELKQQGII
ncbi:MAG: CoA transferase [Pseudomonadota bacterium]